MPGSGQLGRQIAPPQPDDRFHAGPPPPRRNAAQQRDLEQTLPHFDQPLRAEHALEAGHGIDPLPLGLEIGRHPAPAAEAQLREQRDEDDRHRQCEDCGHAQQQALHQQAPDAEIADIARIEQEGFARQLREPFEQQRPRNRQPSAAEQHDGSRARVLGAQDVALLGRVRQPLLGWGKGLFTGGLAHRAITLSVWSSASPTSPVNWS